jgi:MOSC domain-containing protein YiiM
MTPTVLTVSRHLHHSFSKPRCSSVRLLAGLGVEGDAHMGVLVKHRSRVRADPTQPNLRQVHLLQGELFAELAAKGFDIESGDIGENIVTSGIDLLALPTGTRLGLGVDAMVEITGLRNPCSQLDRFRSGLMAAVLDRDAAGNLVRKAGIMGIVVAGGEVRPGDAIAVLLPPPPHQPLEKV